MKLARIAFFAGFAAAAAAGVAAYGKLTFEQPPGFSDLPPSWFVRPATADPANWRLEGAPQVKLGTTSGLNLEIVPEDRTDATASLKGPKGVKPFALGSGDGAYINSDVKLPCPAKSNPEAPTIVLHTPRSVVVRTTGPIAATVAPGDRVLIESDGCASWRIASANQLWLAERHGSQATVGPVIDLRLARWGEGQDRIAATARSADVVIHGKGRVVLDKANGIVEAAVWGSGTIAIGEGFVGRERIWVKGPGQALHRGEAGEITGEARMGGKIRVRQARGVITGSGDIQVGRPGEPVAGL